MYNVIFSDVVAPQDADVDCMLIAEVGLVRYTNKRGMNEKRLGVSMSVNGDI
jgi:hypothetical protein